MRNGTLGLAERICQPGYWRAKVKMRADSDVLFTLSEEQKGSLLVLARSHLECYFRGDKLSFQELEALPGQYYGIFVTLRHQDGELRGCMGQLSLNCGLAEATQRAAIAAARQDSRFPPVQAEELVELSISISLLATPRELIQIEDLEIGRHGVLIETVGARGLLLPQVAVERGWDTVQFLRECCRKAGLASDAWKLETVSRLYFAAVSFGERS